MRRSTIFQFLNRQLILTGSKVRLRPRRFEDATDQYRWRRDEELCSLDASIPTSLAFSEFSDHYCVELEYPGLTCTLAIDTLDGQHIGECSLFNFDFPGNTAELGVLIGEKDFWGRGYGTDAVNLFLQDIFTTSDIERLLLRTLDWNIRAQRCFEKCGFSASSSVISGEYRFTVMEIGRSKALENIQ
ncbi:MAG: GNAT family N-acetyltransferase [Chloroflexi bacterium]|nr:GNAT family N-acetyltransferase [Chloroflexota bacterium]